MPAETTPRARVLVELSLELLDQHTEVGDDHVQGVLDQAIERLAERLLLAADALAGGADDA